MRTLSTLAMLLTAVLATAAARPAQAGSLDPPGPPAPTMKALDQIEPRTPLGTTGPIAIAEPGSYYLTGDLTSVSKGLVVTADDVTVDLAGFTISGDGSHDGVEVNGATNVVVRNGRIKGHLRGVFVTGSLGVRIEALRVIDSALSGVFITGVSRDIAIERCDVSKNTANGIHAWSGNAGTFVNGPIWVKQNTVYDNGATGILINKIIGYVEGNRIFGNDSHGIDIDDAEGYVQDNRSNHNLGNGIQVVNGSIAYVIDNECWFNQNIGILDTSGPGARVARNLVGFNDLTQYDFDAPGAAAPESPLSSGPNGWDNVE